MQAMMRYLNAIFASVMLSVQPSIAQEPNQQPGIDVTWLMDGIFRGGFDTGCGDACKHGVVILFAYDIKGNNIVDMLENRDQAASDALKGGGRWAEEHTMGEWQRSIISTAQEGSFSFKTPSGLYDKCEPEKEDGTRFSCIFRADRGLNVFVVFTKRED
jgi:hypothetical protein